MINLLTRADRYIGAVFNFFLVSLVLSLTALMATSVFLRYVLNMALPAIEELSILIGLWFYFVAIVVVTRERGHLTGGILDLFDLTKKQRTIIKGFNDLVGLGITLFFGYYAIKQVLFLIKINKSSTILDWPISIWNSAAIFGFVFMAIYKIRDIFIRKNAYNMYDNKSHHPDDAVYQELKK